MVLGVCEGLLWEQAKVISAYYIPPSSATYRWLGCRRFKNGGITEPSSFARLLRADNEMKHGEFNLQAKHGICFRSSGARCL